MTYTTCAITGHRPTRFKWKYKENSTGCKRLKKRLHDVFVLLYEKGVRQFYVGGSLGVDQWAGEILLDMKMQPEFDDLHLVVAIPFPDHDSSWDDRSKKRLAYLKCHAEVVVVSAVVGAEGYRRRNHYMVDHSDCLVAVYDNNRAIRSGTGQTVYYAQREGIPIIRIHPDSGEVTFPKPGIAPGLMPSR